MVSERPITVTTARERQAGHGLDSVAVSIEAGSNGARVIQFTREEAWTLHHKLGAYLMGPYDTKEDPTS